jgi:hypothetical protein
MIDRGAKVPVKRQAELLDLSRSSVYYTPRPLSKRDLMLMRRIDELHLEPWSCLSTGRASSPTGCGARATRSAGVTSRR